MNQGIVSSEVRSLVLDRLEGETSAAGVKLLFACESGSRAWGFASPDSDYDIRFIYIHSKEWYLSIEEQRDVIERPIEKHPLGEIDLGGWDLRKTLRLVKKSNPVVWEWLQSPVTYHVATQEVRSLLRDAIDPFFSPITACHHYLAICRGTMERELAGPTVKIKKYFYMLRPILAASWVQRFRSVPPMEFEPLRAMLDSNTQIQGIVSSLLERKAHTDERIPVAREQLLDTWLEEEHARLKALASSLPSSIETSGPADMPNLDLTFRTLLEI